MTQPTVSKHWRKNSRWAVCELCVRLPIPVQSNVGKDSFLNLSEMACHVLSATLRGFSSTHSLRRTITFLFELTYARRNIEFWTICRGNEPCTPIARRSVAWTRCGTSTNELGPFYVTYRMHNMSFIKRSFARLVAALGKASGATAANELHADRASSPRRQFSQLRVCTSVTDRIHGAREM